MGTLEPGVQIVIRDLWRGNEHNVELVVVENLRGYAHRDAVLRAIREGFRNPAVDMVEIHPHEQTVRECSWNGDTIRSYALLPPRER